MGRTVMGLLWRSDCPFPLAQRILSGHETYNDMTLAQWNGPVARHPFNSRRGRLELSGRGIYVWFSCTYMHAHVRILTPVQLGGTTAPPSPRNAHNLKIRSN